MAPGSGSSTSRTFSDSWAGQFAGEGLLDEILLGVAPVTLGAGAPLLPRRLLSSELTLTGVDRDEHFAYLSYQVTPRRP